MFGWREIIWTLVIGAVVLVGRSLMAALFSDIATRLAVNLTGIRLFNFVLGWAVRHPVWSGTWQVHWSVQSENFSRNNTCQATRFRMFNQVAMVGLGRSKTVGEIEYVFIGSLSRDKSVLTGKWSDRRGVSIGYHGVYQLLLSGTGDRAVGTWIGFSTTEGRVKSGDLMWTKLQERKL